MGSGSELGAYGALKPHVGNKEQYMIQRGDIKKGFDEADVIVEDTYTTQVQYHGTIQTRVCVASWDGSNLTVWDSIQGVWNSKLALAFSLGLDPANVRVIVKYLGGGFGSKAWAQRITFYAAKLSMITGRPVRIERTRREEFLSHPRRPTCKTCIKMGAKKDGTITAIYQKTIVNVGAVTFYRPIFVIWHTSQLYACPNVYLEEHAVWTNLQITGPQRSPLNMPAIFALESHIDRMSEELDIDPLEFRLKNYTIYGNQEKKIPYSSKKLDECMKLVTDTIDWKTRKGLRNTKDGAKRRGIGMATSVTPQGAGYAPFDANADVVIKNDGSVNLFIGVVDIGAGQQTIFPMIAAEELGVKNEDITIVYGDTKDTRYAPSCQGSRVTAEVGPAVLQAAADARQKLFKLIAPLLDAKVEDIRSKNGEIYAKSNPTRSINFKTACERINPNNPIKGSGSRAPNPDTPIFATFGAQTAEVEVDIETGEVKVLRIVAAHDFGRAINPKLCISQIYGGVEFGLGYALLEEGIFDPKTGKLLNSNLHQYTIPTSIDMPHIDALIVEGEDPYFAYSAKGAGEVTNTPTPAAIRNAIHNAVAIWLNDLPITPDKVIKAINEKKKVKEKIAIRTI
jgi:CO/xanthine dehydrogenase Mo-binding subunit